MGYIRFNYNIIIYNNKIYYRNKKIIIIIFLLKMKIIKRFNKQFFFLIFIIILVLNKIESEENTENKVIIIPFKSYYPKVYDYPNKNKVLIVSWIKRKVYLDLENISGQKITMLLSLQQPKMHTRDVVSLLKTDEESYEPYKNNVSDICSFNYQLSKTYEKTTPFEYDFYSISKVCYAKEKMYFYNDINLKEKNTYDIEFFHSCNGTNICFFSGLQLTDSLADKKINLLIQLKNLLNSKSYYYTLKYTSPEEGYFIFGDIINNKNLNFYSDNIEENYFYESIPTYSLDTIYWKIFFDKIYFGDHVIESDSSISKIYFTIDFQTRYITVPKDYFYTIKGYYLLNNENTTDFICFNDESEFFFQSVYCDKKKYLELTDNYKKLPVLNLFGRNHEVNITFTPKELFIEKDDTLFFFIAYNKHKEEEWNFGSIFLEKYITVFNNDQKKLSVLKRKITEEQDTNNNINNNESSSKYIIIIILVVILTALIFGFLGLFFGKKIYNRRKKKANELNDEFEYSQEYNYENNENKNTQLMGNNIN